MLSVIDNNTKRISEIIKLNFFLKHRVQYGQAIYVVGNIPILGQWSVSSAFRLTWSQGDEWTGHLVLNRKYFSRIQFKYVIALWDNPQSGLITWQQGLQNRIITFENYRNSITCNHKWNCDKICLYLFDEQAKDTDQYFIIGNTSELGNWKTMKQMKPKAINEQSFIDISLRKNPKIDGIKFQGKNILSFTFYAPRTSRKLHYYYIKKGNKKLDRERHPGRRIHLDYVQETRHPHCFHIGQNSGNIQIFQSCEFGKLHISQITKNIFLGAYLRTKEDFDSLKKQKIDAILAIQTKQDYSSHNLSNNYLMLQSQEQGCKYYCYEIKDMSAIDFIEKSLGAFLLLKKLVNENHNKVYVHCSAGVYRSPQLVVLFLVLAQNYGLDEAIQFVKKKHPFSRPNYTVLCQALQQIKKKIEKLI